METCKKCGGIAEWNSYFGGVTCTRCGYVEKPKPTNFDRIRSMGVEEMAKLIYSLDGSQPYCIAGKDFALCWNSECEDCVTRWLMQEAE